MCLTITLIVSNLLFANISFASLVDSNTATIHIAPGDTKHDISTQMLWLKDEHNKFSFDQVKNLTDQQFNLPDGYSFSRGYTSSGYWFKFDLIFSPERLNNNRWLLEIPFPLLDYVDLYMPDGNGGFSVIETGDRRPFFNRIMTQPTLYFLSPPISIKARIT